MNKSKIKTLCFDIDGVICTTSQNPDYNKSRPIKGNIKTINLFYLKGYKIVLNTARYMGRTNGNLKEVKRKIKPLTLKQLKNWNVNYHKIYFGKPSFDLFIDDKSLFFDKNWGENLLKKLKIS